MLPLFAKEFVMEKPIIRLGDPTTHGGVVVSASADTLAQGKPVARVGDSVTCPIPGHGGGVIVEGDSTTLLDGRPIALQGHMTSCGAALISTLSEVVVSRGGAGNQSRSSAVGHVAPDGASTVRQLSDINPFDERVHLIGESHIGLPYFIKMADGRMFSGRVGADGLLPRVVTRYEDDYEIFWGDEALARQSE